MTSRPAVIFDFDGTLPDSFSLLLDSYNRLAPQYKATQVTPDDITRLREDTNPKAALKEFNISLFKLPRLIRAVRADFKKNISTVALHPGIGAAIRDLRDRGYQLGILSSNDADTVKQIIARHELQDYFEFYYSNNKVFKKQTNLRKIFKTHHIDPTSVVYVGDETRDVRAANAINIPSLAVSWGFQSADALMKAGATRVVSSPDELTSTISSLLTI